MPIANKESAFARLHQILEYSNWEGIKLVHKKPISNLNDHKFQENAVFGSKQVDAPIFINDNTSFNYLIKGRECCCALTQAQKS